MITLAFDTATAVATSALVWDGEVLGELSVHGIERLGSIHDDDRDAPLTRQLNGHAR